MTFICYECSTPMVITRDTLKLASAQQLPINCPKCKSTYRITVEQLSVPDAEMAEKLREERVGMKSVNGKSAGAAAGAAKMVNDMGSGGGVL